MELEVVDIQETRKSLKKNERSLLIKRFLSNKLILTGSIIFLFIFLLSVIGPFFVSYTPYEMIMQHRLQGPSVEHLLGTDNFGRDLLSRMIHGAQASLVIGFSIAAITGVLGLVIGLYASYYKTLDHILMRICDGLMSIPAILFAIGLMAALGPSERNVVIALSIVFTPQVARIVRSVSLVVCENTFVEAMIAQGASATRIIWLHIAPNTVSPLVVQATFIFANSIIIEAALSFLGAGVPAPDPSWGNILYDGKFVIDQAWWMILFPGIMLILTVVSLNMLGDGLRDMLDPHTNKAKGK